MSNGFRPSHIGLLLAAWAIAVAGFVYLLLDHESDPLCAALADTFGLQCSNSFAAAAALPPGTLVDAAGQPQGTLTGSGCLLPGAIPPVLADRQLAATPAALPRQTYTMLSGSGGNAIPGPAGLFNDAGRWPGLQEVGVELDALRETAWTSTTVPAGLACQLRTDCAERLAGGTWRLVTGVLAGEVRYRALDRNQRALAPTGAGSGLVPGRDAWALQGPRVVALRFADSSTIDALARCDHKVTRMHAGRAVARIDGGNQRGALAADTMQQALGKVALASARGTEVSDCDPGLGRQRSHAYAQALVDSLADGGLRMAAEVRASSGRFRAGRCSTTGRRLPSNNMLVTRASSAVQLDGELAMLVRASGPHTLQIDWNEFPIGTRLRATGPDGRVLHDATLTEADGTHRFEIVGPGVFRVQPTVAAQIDREGESGVKSTSFHGVLHAWAWPPGGEAAAKAGSGEAAAKAGRDEPATDGDAPEAAADDGADGTGA